jgi:ABC-type nitrate/sulfonate/bicarbonate transport system substrate-binding protein
MSPWQAGVWVVSSEFARKNPEQTKAVIAALYDAIEFIKRDPAAAKGALSEFTSIRPAVAERTPTIPFAPSASADLVTLQRHADILTEKGIVSKRIDVRGLIAPLEWTQRQQ